MPYLIDGHNLIGQLPDIDIADPHDEAKLVLKLRGFAGRTGKKITVVFDGGIPAGFSAELSTHSVQVRFASPVSSADRLIMQVVRQTQNPTAWTLVSSDYEVVELARRYGMQHINATDFATVLHKQMTKTHKKREDAIKSNPRLSQKEIDEWLKLFGENPSQKP